jgi:hypothetical protein
MAEWLCCLARTTKASTVFEPRRHQKSNNVGQVTNDCLSRITRK